MYNALPMYFSAIHLIQMPKSSYLGNKLCIMLLVFTLLRFSISFLQPTSLPHESNDYKYINSLVSMFPDKDFNNIFNACMFYVGSTDIGRDTSLEIENIIQKKLDPPYKYGFRLAINKSPASIAELPEYSRIRAQKFPLCFENLDQKLGVSVSDYEFRKPKTQKFDVNILECAKNIGSEVNKLLHEAMDGEKEKIEFTRAIGVILNGGYSSRYILCTLVYVPIDEGDSLDCVTVKIARSSYRVDVASAIDTLRRIIGKDLISAHGEYMKKTRELIDYDLTNRVSLRVSFFYEKNMDCFDECDFLRLRLNRINYYLSILKKQPPLDTCYYGYLCKEVLSTASRMKEIIDHEQEAAGLIPCCMPRFNVENLDKLISKFAKYESYEPCR